VRIRGAGQIDDVRVLRAQPVDKPPLVGLALVLEGDDEAVRGVRSCEVAVRGRHVEADAVAAGEEAGEIGRGKDQAIRNDVHGLPIGTAARPFQGALRSASTRSHIVSPHACIPVTDPQARPRSGR
jgi:hypothetical protein